MSKLSSKSKKQVNWDVNTEGAEYVKAAELKEGEVFTLHGAYLTKDNGYGLGSVLITDIDGVITCVNAPQATVDIVKEILEDTEIQESIKAGHEGFKVRAYMNNKLKKPKKCFAIDFVEIQ